mgnify:CR=1 FL=1
MLAKRTNIILGEILSLVNVVADLASPAFRLIGGRSFLRLDVCMVIAIGDTGSIRQHFGLYDLGNIEHLGLQIIALQHFAAENRVGVGGDVADAVCGAVVVIHIGKLVHVTSGLEAELLEEDALSEDDFEEETTDVSNPYKAYNADRTDWDPEELAQELETPPRRGCWGLLAVALVIVLLLQQINQ